MSAADQPGRWWPRRHPEIMEWRLLGRRGDAGGLPPVPEAVEWRMDGRPEIIEWRPDQWRLRHPRRPHGESDR